MMRNTMIKPHTSKKGFKAFIRIASVRILLGIVAFTALYDQFLNFFNNDFKELTKDRQLSIDLGNGNCKWTPPLYVPSYFSKLKTLEEAHISCFFVFLFFFFTSDILLNFLKMLHTSKHWWLAIHRGTRGSHLYKWKL